MENALSNPRDNLSARGESRAQPCSSVAPSTSSSPSSQAPQYGPVVGKAATSDVASMIAADGPSAAAGTTAETNNNLKIFKSEYDTKPTAAENMKTQNNGASEHHHNQTTSKKSMVSASTSPGDETDLTDLSTTCHQLAKCTLSAGDTTNNSTEATVDSAASTSTATSASDQSHSDPEQQQQQHQQQQQQVPSATGKLPPTVANNRSILILREIQPDTLESSVREIFTSENCPSRPVHCEYALHNSWYVTFKDDEEARLALGYIRKHIIRWQGKPIMARYKPKPAVPSASNEPPSTHLQMHQPHTHSHHQDPHQIVPSMVMQQQHQEHQQNDHYHNGTLDTVAAVAGQVPSPGFLGVPSASAASLDGDHEHNVQPPVVMSPEAIINHTGGAPPLSSHSPSLMTAYGPQHSPYHNQHSDGLLHHPAHHNLAHMMGSFQQPQMANYAPYYNQHGQLLHASWDLSSVFIYNGLSPYNKTSVSGVSFVDGAYHNQPPPPQPVSSHLHQAHLNHHYPPQHQRHYQGNNNSNHHHNNHHQRMNQHHGQSHHNHHSSNHHQGNSNSGGNSHQQVFANNHHHGDKSSRKNNKQSNNK